MGIDSFFRNFLRTAYPQAFYPREGSTWLDVSGVRVMIDDINMRLRGYGFDPDWTAKTFDHGACMRRWGDVSTRLKRDYAKYFAEGARVIIPVFDGKVPPCKRFEQEKRKEQHESKVKSKELETGKPPFRWPKEDDRKPWFVPESPCHVSANEIYYGGALAKLKWYQFITEFLLYEMPLPPAGRIIIDCGAHAPPREKTRELEGPVEAFLDHDFGSSVDAETLSMLASGDPNVRIRRIVREMPDEPRYDTYNEADDRMVYWAFRATVEWGESVVVCSDDGDSLASLMSTRNPRMAVAKHMPRDRKLGAIYLRRREGVAKLRDAKGKSHMVTQPELIDVDALAEFVATVFGSLLVEGAHAISARDGEPIEKKLAHTDPVLFYCMLILMRKNDYSEGFSGLSGLNIMRGVAARPDLALEALYIDRPTESQIQRELLDRRLDEEDMNERYAAGEAPGKRVARDECMLRLSVPTMCVIRSDKFREFVRTCYREAYAVREKVTKTGKDRTAPDIYESKYPMPIGDSIDATGARMAWALDKCANSGRPCYMLDDPFKRSEATDLPLYGYVQDKCTKAVSYPTRVDSSFYLGVVQDWALRPSDLMSLDK